jgi:hypothetical protein
MTTPSAFVLTKRHVCISSDKLPYTHPATPSFFALTGGFPVVVAATPIA